MENDSNKEFNEIKNFLKGLEKKVEKKIEQNGQISKKDLEKYKERFDKVWEKGKDIPTPRFNGFTLEQMALMQDFPFGSGCPVQLCNLSENDIEKIPFMRQALYLMNQLREKELNLIQRYWMPSKIVEKLYELGCHIHSYDPSMEKTEKNIHEVSFLREILYRLGLIKDIKGKLTLTAQGQKLLSDHNALLDIILFYLFTDFDTAWFDSVSNLDNIFVGNIGRLYSLWLLHHFGNQQHDLNFYVNQYFTAFPKLLKKTDEFDSYIEGFDVFKDSSDIMYITRVYENLFPWLGICKINTGEENRGVNRDSKVNKTPLLDMMFSFEEPAKI